MVARPRKPGNKDLPPNLSKYKGYYSYRHPITRKHIGLGNDREEAINAAIEANLLLIRRTESPLINNRGK